MYHQIKFGKQADHKLSISDYTAMNMKCRECKMPYNEFGHSMKCSRDSRITRGMAKFVELIITGLRYIIEDGYEKLGFYYLSVLEIANHIESDTLYLSGNYIRKECIRTGIENL